MKLLKLLVLAVTMSVGYVAQAQVPIGPFVSPVQERFDTIAAGSYGAFAGFGGVAGFSSIPSPGGGAMVVGGGATLPPISLPHAMFGRGVDVRIRFASPWKRFGGYFRVPNAGIPVTLAQFRFFQGAALVAVVNGPVNTGIWQWYGWDLGAIGGFDRVEIYGNGGLAGYVGMENMVVG